MDYLLLVPKCLIHSKITLLLSFQNHFFPHFRNSCGEKSTGHVVFYTLGVAEDENRKCVKVENRRYVQGESERCAKGEN